MISMHMSRREEFTEGEEVMEENLDVPGAELDDEDELIGEEDEENNYYSLGGDNHDDLEEIMATKTKCFIFNYIRTFFMPYWYL